MKLHLPKMLLTAVLAAISTAAYSADTEIWVNFGNTNEGVTDDTKVWNNILGNNGAASDFMIPCLVEQAEQEKRDWTQVVV